MIFLSCKWKVSVSGCIFLISARKNIPTQGVLSHTGSFFREFYPTWGRFLDLAGAFESLANGRLAAVGTNPLIPLQLPTRSLDRL